jgi:hypothetical protein
MLKTRGREEPTMILLNSISTDLIYSRIRALAVCQAESQKIRSRDATSHGPDTMTWVCDELVRSLSESQ